MGCICWLGRELRWIGPGLSYFWTLKPWHSTPSAEEDRRQRGFLHCCYQSRVPRAPTPSAREELLHCRHRKHLRLKRTAAVPPSAETETAASTLPAPEKPPRHRHCQGCRKLKGATAVSRGSTGVIPAWPGQGLTKPAHALLQQYQVGTPVKCSQWQRQLPQHFVWSVWMFGVRWRCVACRDVGWGQQQLPCACVM